MLWEIVYVRQKDASGNPGPAKPLLLPANDLYQNPCASPTTHRPNSQPTSQLASQPASQPVIRLTCHLAASICSASNIWFHNKKTPRPPAHSVPRSGKATHFALPSPPCLQTPQSHFSCAAPILKKSASGFSSLHHLHSAQRGVSCICKV